MDCPPRHLFQIRMPYNIWHFKNAIAVLEHLCMNPWAHFYGIFEHPYRNSTSDLTINYFCGECRSVDFLPQENWTELQLIRYKIVAVSRNLDRLAFHHAKILCIVLRLDRPLQNAKTLYEQKFDMLNSHNYHYHTHSSHYKDAGVQNCTHSREVTWYRSSVFHNIRNCSLTNICSSFL